MAREISIIDSPIDVMFLLHKAFLAMTARVETLAAGLELGGDLQEFTAKLHHWVKLLRYHAEAGDLYVTQPLAECKAARANEAEHAALVQQAGELIGLVSRCDAGGSDDSAMLAESKVAARARRHVYSRIVALRVAELDHFENEEVFVLPVVRERMTDVQQLGIARRLLIDEESEDPRWIMEWLAAELSPPGRALLAAMETFIEATALDVATKEKSRT